VKADNVFFAIKQSNLIINTRKPKLNFRKRSTMNVNVKNKCPSVRISWNEGSVYIYRRFSGGNRSAGAIVLPIWRNSNEKQVKLSCNQCAVHSVCSGCASCL